MLYTGTMTSPFGPLHCAVSDYAVRSVRIGDANPPAGESIPMENHPLMLELRAWLTAYFAGKRPDVRALPLRPDGSDFQLLVWQLLLQIPYGELVSYGELAAQAAAMLGRSRLAAQAIGGAVGRNPIAIVIPCHRVVGARGELTGYACGLAVKARLLRHEGALLA